MLTVLVRNELEKTWRSRWMVFAVLAGLFLLIALSLYSYYVYHDHRWSPPPPVTWQNQARSDIANNQSSLDNLQTIRQQAGTRGRVLVSGRSLDDAEARLHLAIAADQYLLDNNIAPLSAFSVTRTALFALGGIIMFLLVRIFGWLASEQIAGERSERTIAILLSRPPSRDQILVAKAIASFVTSLAVVVASFLVTYAVVAFLMGAAGPLAGQVGIPIDGSKPLNPNNLVIMPISVFVLMCIGGAMLAVLCVQGMSLLISVLTGRWAAIGITLGVLFGASLLSHPPGGDRTQCTWNAPAAMTIRGRLAGPARCLPQAVLEWPYRTDATWCTAHVINEFLVHYHQARPHQGLEQRCPDPVPALLPLPVGAKIVRHDRLGGLLHEYSRAA